MTHHLTLENLVIEANAQPLVEGVGFTVRSGELVALVGESGAGKSLTGRSLVGILPSSVHLRSGTVTWHRPGEPDIVIEAPPAPNRSEALSRLRGQGVAWIPQDAGAALVPVHTVQRQLRDALRHVGASSDRPHCAQQLAQVGFAEPDAVLDLYPHMLSGGMARRVQVALGLSLGAAFLMADEPTTGLDRPVQARLLQTLGRIRDRGTGILLITHDLRMVERHADRVIVFDQGRVVAEGTPDLLQTHHHAAVQRLRGQP
ncbi:MAG: hypothetical protein CL927_05475 [Deltaproteobacteria bacterium]|nr:hypothetical protein [Deltaproteobacteria bacterium]HCH63199.1 hypothetical protein [Deltaproteobacteria bacterium]